jgi:hypothetical protein
MLRKFSMYNFHIISSQVFPPSLLLLSYLFLLQHSLEEGKKIVRVTEHVDTMNVEMALDNTFLQF